MASRLIEGKRKWVNTDLNGNNIGRFKEYCRDMHINFKTSKAEYDYIHFECLMSAEEMELANQFIYQM